MALETNSQIQNVEHRDASDAETVDVADLNSDLAASIDALGASVLNVKRSQTIEDQAAVEELEARYMALRRDYEAYDAASKARDSEAQKGDGHSVLSDAQDKAQEALTVARDRVSTSYHRLKDYFSDEENKSRLKERAGEARGDLARAWSSVSKSIETTWREIQKTPDRGDEKAEHKTSSDKPAKSSDDEKQST